MNRTFVGFGFGPIQSALFLLEAYRSGNFSRFIVAEIDRTLVEALRANDGNYTVNIARKHGIDQFELRGMEVLDPRDHAERKKLIAAIAESEEMATALPSVRFFDASADTSIARLVAEGLLAKEEGGRAIIYAAENHNHAAELLQQAVEKYVPNKKRLKSIQFLNTVVGKMSGVIADPEIMKQLNLTPIVPGISRAILVEEFNRILVSEVELESFERGIGVFQEKKDLLPFEEAKLYGHNAIHAMIAYLADLKGLRTIADAADHPEIMEAARDAFINESGATLIHRHQDLGDPLFTVDGYTEFADDLLERMVNPYLNDLVERVGRDHVRKLGYEDRLYGTMRLALLYRVDPRQLGLGAAAGVVSLIRRQADQPHTEGLPIPESVDALDFARLNQLLLALWGDKADRFADDLVQLTWESFEQLKSDGWL